ncbi:hypothetical protein DICVIV_00971 [Dictyocaulus viviparus]|uniref:Uncharacterized protein n=1 Tax=Dictyocaulus viviparus TaxID=29172 RepID=A0A0D8Y9X7_DICVI|nr:hypothetical protein DICVIV_00971 [Dictyocaulus viviparus]
MEDDNDEAIEALDLMNCLDEAAEVTTDSASPSSSYGQTGAPIFCSMDAEQVIGRYGQFIEKFQFNQAREAIEQYTQSTSKPLMIINEKDVSWATLLSALSMIANCDKNYYLLSFLQPKAFFRKENALKNQYYQIGENLLRTCPPSALLENGTNDLPVADHLISQCRQYVQTRIKLINMYTTIASLANDRLISWESIHDRGLQIAGMLQSFQKSSLLSMAHLLSGEIDILLLLVSAQIHISNCKMFESLLQLKEIRNRFDYWVRDSHCLSSVNKSVLYFFRSTEKLPRNRLINWFVQFYNLLMAKFSLYFTNVLSNFCSIDDLKTIYTIDNGYNFISNASHLVKKTDAACLAIVMDREKSTEDFYGFGYHRLKDRFTPGALTEPRKGLAALCPAVFRLPSPMDNHKSVQSNDVFEKYQESIYNFIQSNLRQPSKNRYFHDAEKDYSIFGDMVESNLYLVVVYTGRVCEKEPTVSSFIQHMTTSLRGSSLFLSLKNAAK